MKLTDEIERELCSEEMRKGTRKSIGWENAVLVIALIASVSVIAREVVRIING